MSASAVSSVRICIENSACESERAEIKAVNEAAFGGPDEAGIVDRLRSDGHVLVSLVARPDAAGVNTPIVGHCMFSRMWIEAPGGLIDAVALAPVAVHPAFQRQGIGTRMIEHGLDLVRARNERIVIVAGHPAYYPRFGFLSSRAARIRSPFPPEAFMALELTPDALDGIAGSAVYPSAFGI